MTAAQGRLFGPNRRRSGRVRAGWDETVKALRDTGRIERADEALIKLGRVIADQLDDACGDPDEKRYNRFAGSARMLDAVRLLYDRTGGVGDTGPDSLADLLARVGDTAHPDPPD